jgi:hypothetical protein
LIYSYKNIKVYPTYQLSPYFSYVELRFPITGKNLYDQYSLIEQTYPSHTFRAGVDWFVAPGQTIGALFNGTYNDRDIDVVSQAAVSRTGSLGIDSTTLSDTWQKSTYNSQM